MHDRETFWWARKENKRRLAESHTCTSSQCLANTASLPSLSSGNSVFVVQVYVGSVFWPGGTSGCS